MQIISPNYDSANQIIFDSAYLSPKSIIKPLFTTGEKRLNSACPVDVNTIVGTARREGDQTDKFFSKNSSILVNPP